MIDKRSIYALLNGVKEFVPEAIAILESARAALNEVPDITDAEKKALIQHPMQFVRRISKEDGEWTTQLHIWAENGVPEILDLDPIYLGFKDSYGDSVLMCLTVAATGTHTGQMNYDMIEEIVTGDYRYEEAVSDDDSDGVVVKNAMDETDIHGKTPLDYLADIANGTDDYSDDIPDVFLQEILQLPVIETFSPDEIIDTDDQEYPDEHSDLDEPEYQTKSVPNPL